VLDSCSPRPDLEESAGLDRKRRVTDFYFQRIRLDAPVAVPQRITTSPQAIWSTPAAPGIPPIRLVSLEKQKATQDNEQEVRGNTKEVTAKQTKQSNGQDGEKPEPESFAQDSTKAKPARETRRFHLTRHISSVLSPSPAGGIRKSKHFLRPPLPTFIEKNPKLRKEALTAEETPNGSKLRSKPAKASLPKTGTSINDDPRTWDTTSEKLAAELLALALEFDPEAKAKVDSGEVVLPPVKEPKVLPTALKPGDTEMVTAAPYDDYVMETYIRIQYDTETNAFNPDTGGATDFGILVIDEENEDLWQQYVESEEDSEWDEEDSNGEYCSGILLYLLLTVYS
jgi:hypothetical protein